MALRGGGEHPSERVELGAGVDPACRVVRRVHNDHARARADRGSDGLKVEVEAFGRQVHRDGRARRAADQRAVAEPARARVEHLVADLKHRQQRCGDRAEAASGDGDVRRLVGPLARLAERAGDRLARCRVVFLVCEPVDVARLGVAMSASTSPRSGGSWGLPNTKSQASGPRPRSPTIRCVKAVTVRLSSARASIRLDTVATGMARPPVFVAAAVGTFAVRPSRRV